MDRKGENGKVNEWKKLVRGHRWRGKLKRLFWQDYFQFRQEDRATTLNGITCGTCLKHKQGMKLTKISRNLIKTSVLLTLRYKLTVKKL